MSAKYRTRGHLVEGKDNRTGRHLPCTRCGHYPSKKGHDWCLRNLPGVRYACCGHGEEDAYIQFSNGITIRGQFKVEPSVERQGE